MFLKVDIWQSWQNKEKEQIRVMAMSGGGSVMYCVAVDDAAGGAACGRAQACAYAKGYL